MRLIIEHVAVSQKLSLLNEMHQLWRITQRLRWIICSITVFSINKHLVYFKAGNLTHLLNWQFCHFFCHKKPSAACKEQMEITLNSLLGSCKLWGHMQIGNYSPDYPNSHFGFNQYQFSENQGKTTLLTMPFSNTVDADFGTDNCMYVRESTTSQETTYKETHK